MAYSHHARRHGPLMSVLHLQNDQPRSSLDRARSELVCAVISLLVPVGSPCLDSLIFRDRDRREMGYVATCCSGMILMDTNLRWAALFET